MEQDRPPEKHDPAPAPHKRRVRYGGTHPRKFDQRYKELAPDKYPQMQEHIRAQGRTPAGSHVPIMVQEVLEHLGPQAGDRVADCTLGHGGHAEAFIQRIAPGGKLVGLDIDGGELERTRERLLETAAGVEIVTVRSNFAGLGKVMADLKIDGFNVVFADLGVSSMQLDDPTRGFSYKHDGPLDMRMDDRKAATAADLLERMTHAELDAALLEFADEEDHAAIASAIVEHRRRGRLRRTEHLVELVLAAKGLDARTWRRRVPAGSLHPAARTFQALRILVNDELGSLKQLLRVLPYCLAEGGRAGILTFHSGEDRLVKKSFRDGVDAGLYSATNDDVIRPSRTEIHDNPRSSGAKLRFVVR